MAEAGDGTLQLLACQHLRCSRECGPAQSCCPSTLSTRRSVGVSPEGKREVGGEWLLRAVNIF